MNESEEPASPCISVCLLDEEDICVGCYRSANEITEWFTASAEGKREMLRRSRERQERANPVRLL
jgi:predicted Fe-S protein YdhL (DUF1289 family)